MPGFIGVSAPTWVEVTPSVATSTRLYVVGDSGTLYKSSDGGVTWTTLDTGIGGGTQYRLAVQWQASGNDVVYVSSNDAFHLGSAVSEDGGATFSPITGPTPAANALEVGPDGTAYWNGTYRSTDHGATWAAIPSGGFMENATTSKLWSEYDSTGVSRMNLDGSSQEVIPLTGAWVSGPHCFGQSDTMGLAFGAGDDDASILEKVVGTTATVITPPSAIAWPYMGAASNDGGTTILALILEQDSGNPHIGQLWRSADGGSSWTKVVESEDLMPNTLDVGPQIAYDPNDTSLWYVLGGRFMTEDADAVVWQSIDNGVTWEATAVAAGETKLNVIRAASG
jgi:hypothetical protein